MSEHNELIDIRDSIARQEETGKAILTHIERITKDIDKIKDDLGDHGKEITLIQAEAKFARDTVEKQNAERKAEIDAIWARLRDGDARCTITNDKLEAKIREASDNAGKAAVKDMKLWFIISAVTVALGASAGLTAAILYAGRLLQRVDYIEASIKTIQGVVK